MADTLMKLKGAGDIIVAAILAANPSLVYESVVARALHRWTGLHLSSAAAAPGFNHAIACMVAAVGIGSVVASYQGPAARQPIIVMNGVWALLAGLTCATPREWQLGSATMLMTFLNGSIYTITMIFLSSSKKKGSKGKKGN
ncbi:hypothetical protein EST38_g7227 [Candolleomyces aberdarensis]|uniref:Uncharacterized protein n=1 Tax=Candolleomyces aberdarensis TaxID=2316362 RepID=A0A4Q2DFN4_9AGAR|nr:hypothetical protein EST38_g7227 [Candolleomyces aberdarensis]